MPHGIAFAAHAAWTLSLALAALQILAAVAGVDLDAVAGVDEQGHLDLSAGLQGGGLGHVAHRVALGAGFGLGDFKDEGRRDFDVQRLFVVEQHAAFLASLR